MKRAILGILAATAISAGSAHAGPMAFGLMGGMSLPTGDAGDFFKTGFQAGIYGDYWTRPNVAIGIDVAGNFLSAKDEIDQATNTLVQDEISLVLIGQSYSISSLTSDLKNTASLIQFGVHVKYRGSSESSALRPFAQAGLGFYNVRSKLKGSVSVSGTTPPPGLAPFSEMTDIDDSTTESKLGVNLGGGVMFANRSTVHVGIAGSFHDVFTDDGSTQFFNIGVILEGGRSGDAGSK